MDSRIIYLHEDFAKRKNVGPEPVDAEFSHLITDKFATWRNAGLFYDLVYGHIFRKTPVSN